MGEENDRDRIISSYYGNEAVTALISLKVDTKNTNSIALSVSELDEVLDVYVVTGDIDIIARGHFDSYDTLRTFVMEKLRTIPGIRDTNTFHVVTKYKEDGKILVMRPEQAEEEE